MTAAVVAAVVAAAAAVAAAARAEGDAPHVLDEVYRPCQDESICIYMERMHGILVFMQTSRQMRT